MSPGCGTCSIWPLLRPRHAAERGAGAAGAQGIASAALRPQRCWCAYRRRRCPLPLAPEAAQAHCGFLLPCLRVLAEQLRACSQQVGTLLRTMAGEPGGGESIGCGDCAVSAWGWAENYGLALCGSRQPLAERDYQVLRTHVGSPPSRSKVVSVDRW